MAPQPPPPEPSAKPAAPPMFASVGRGPAASGAGGASLRTLAVFVALGIGVALLDDWLRGPPPIPPVAVDMMAEEAAEAAAQVEAEGGLRPLPEEPPETTP